MAWCSIGEKPLTTTIHDAIWRHKTTMDQIVPDLGGHGTTQFRSCNTSIPFDILNDIFACLNPQKKNLAHNIQCSVCNILNSSITRQRSYPCCMPCTEPTIGPSRKHIYLALQWGNHHSACHRRTFYKLIAIILPEPGSFKWYLNLDLKRHYYKQSYDGCQQCAEVPRTRDSLHRNICTDSRDIRLLPIANRDRECAPSAMGSAHSYICHKTGSNEGSSSTLPQVIAWCRRASNITWTNVDSDL